MAERNDCVYCVFEDTIPGRGFYCRHFNELMGSGRAQRHQESCVGFQLAESMRERWQELHDSQKQVSPVLPGKRAAIVNRHDSKYIKKLTESNLWGLGILARAAHASELEKFFAAFTLPLLIDAQEYSLTCFKAARAASEVMKLTSALRKGQNSALKSAWERQVVAAKELRALRELLLQKILLEGFYTAESLEAFAVMQIIAAALLKKRNDSAQIGDDDVPRFAREIRLMYEACRATLLCHYYGKKVNPLMGYKDKLVSQAFANISSTYLIRINLFQDRITAIATRNALDAIDLAIVSLPQEDESFQANLALLTGRQGEMLGNLQKLGWDDERYDCLEPLTTEDDTFMLCLTSGEPQPSIPIFYKQQLFYHSYMGLDIEYFQQP